MKKVVNVGIGGRSFILEEDAYFRLDQYLELFRQRTQMGYLTREVMEDLECRIAEIFTETLSSREEVVNLALVERVIAQLGMPDGEGASGSEFKYNEPYAGQKINKKLYRDSDNKLVGGVCSGFSCYFDVDVTVLRVLFLAALILGGFGFWIYIVVWFVAPMAKTASQKCEMRGLPINAENLRRFSNSK
ncbi:MAG: PspC domain-containing protein [Bacteroidales bacterium]|jgi:phage shock protein PspC (stress-responsive transcriptional regulator)|nr:PspC domain-containing protein [Bacteroidales bacterium]